MYSSIRQPGLHGRNSLLTRILTGNLRKNRPQTRKSEQHIQATSIPYEKNSVRRGIGNSFLESGNTSARRGNFYSETAAGAPALPRAAQIVYDRGQELADCSASAHANRRQMRVHVRSKVKIDGHGKGRACVIAASPYVYRGFVKLLGSCTFNKSTIPISRRHEIIFSTRSNRIESEPKAIGAKTTFSTLFATASPSRSETIKDFESRRAPHRDPFR